MQLHAAAALAMPYINIFAVCHAERTAACNDPRARCDGPGSSSMCVYRTEWSITKEPKCRHGMLNLSNPHTTRTRRLSRGEDWRCGPLRTERVGAEKRDRSCTPNSWSKLRCLLCTKISRIGRSAHGRERNAQAQRATASSFDSLKTSDGCTKTNHAAVLKYAYRTLVGPRSVAARDGVSYSLLTER